MSNKVKIYKDRKTGRLSAEQLMNPSYWCECESPNWTFHPDGEPGALIVKHHYTCNKCNGIIQIG